MSMVSHVFHSKFFSSGAIFLVLAVLVIGAGVWYVAFDSPSRVQEDAKTLRSRKIAEAKAKARKSGEKGTRMSRGEVIKEKAVHVKPNFSAEAEDEAKLTGAMRKLFAELQDALDANDKKKVYALVHKLQKMDEWPDDVPKSVKMKALEAIAWFGPSGAAEATGFLADSDPEVVQETLDKFEEMLMDCELGDTGVSEILKQLVKVVHDTDALEMFYMEMNNMRGTIKAETTLAILDTGTAEAVAVMKDNIDFLYGTDIEADEIKREDIEKFLKEKQQEYKDNPELAKDDEEFYGPPKD